MHDEFRRFHASHLTGSWVIEDRFQVRLQGFAGNCDVIPSTIYKETVMLWEVDELSGDSKIFKVQISNDLSLKFSNSEFSKYIILKAFNI